MIEDAGFDVEYGVVGAGILGLAAAEALSRRGKGVVVVRDPADPGASFAAAANLATKAQGIAREEHFGWKLRAKETYRAWLAACGVPGTLLTEGRGLDVFADRESADAQEKRVAPGAAAGAVVRPSDTTVAYEGECWIDARGLLSALEAILRARGVTFVEREVDGRGALRRAPARARLWILCAGARSLPLVSALGLEARDAKARTCMAAVRYSAGTVLRAGAGYESAWDTAFARLPGGGRPASERPVLLEFPFGGLKVTLSGCAGGTFVSSSTVRTGQWDPRAITPEERVEWEAEDVILERAAATLLPLGAGHEAWKGVRVSFGRTELLACPLWRAGSATGEDTGEAAAEPPAAFLLAGAHKSGFLYAPVVGQILQGLGLP